MPTVEDVPTVRAAVVRPLRAELRRGDHVGPYEVTAEVAAGGMSVVYEVKHRDRGSTHALKVIDPGLLNGKPRAYKRMLAARARREGRIQNQLEHPNVVRVTDTVPMQGGPGLVMELVQGPTLHCLLAQQAQLDWAEVQEIGDGFLAGLGAAHAIGVVHRDVKPGNVLLEKQQGRWLARLADFGLAKDPPGALDDELTKTGQVMGTVGYMPPEQMTCAKHVDAGVDVFAAGAVLFELVTGHPLAPTWTEADPETVSRGLRRLKARKDVPERMRVAVRLALYAAPSTTVEDVSAAWRGEATTARPWRRVASMVLWGLIMATAIGVFLLV